MKAGRAIAFWWHDFNTARPHSSLRHKIPVGFTQHLTQSDPTLRQLPSPSLRRLFIPLLKRPRLQSPLVGAGQPGSCFHFHRQCTSGADFSDCGGVSGMM